MTAGAKSDGTLVIDRVVPRSQGIGASEIGAIAGVNPWQSPFDVYVDKLGLREKPVGQPARWGKRLERVIAEAYEEEKSCCVEWCDRTIQGPSSIQIATPDGFVVANGQRAEGLECKNVGLRQAHRWGESGTDDIPLEYVAQCLWLCAVTGLDSWNIAALFGGNDLRCFHVQRDREAETALLGIAQKFWHDHIERREPPAIDTSETARGYLKQRFPKATLELRPATEQERDWMREYVGHRAVEKFAKNKKEAVGMGLKESIADAAGVLWDTDTYATYKNNKDKPVTSWQLIALGLMNQFVPEEEKRKTLIGLHTRPKPGERVLRVTVKGFELEGDE